MEPEEFAWICEILSKDEDSDYVHQRQVKEVQL